MIRRCCMRSNAIASISARWARERPTPSVASGCRRKAPGIAISPAFTRRLACRSARSRLPRSRWRSWPRSPRSCGCPRKKKKPRHEIRSCQPGVLVVDRAAVDRINGVDEAITFATLAAYKPVVEGEMVATVKLIPFGVEAKLRDAAVKAASGGALRIAPYTIKRVGIVSTLLPGLAPKVVEKTLRVTAERLAPAGATIIAERRVPHVETALAAAIKELLGLGAELVIVFGASAIADRRDVIPAAITEIGGAIEHFGMPVDPGNLLLIGSAGGVPVLGAPGCARSPVENGFDWVLMRLLAGLKVTRAELTGMGVGGLLMEIVTRPQPREKPGTDGNRNVAAIILAAGRSTRMGGPNKLLAELGGKTLVRIVTEQALASKAVVAPFLQRVDGARGRHRRPSFDRQTQRGGSGGPGRGCGGLSR